MKKIVYYITDQGRGHATRSVAIIREILKLGIEVIIRNNNVRDFLSKSLPNVIVKEGKTDVGTTLTNNAISIDIDKTEENIIHWINQFENNSDTEYDFITKFNVDLLISDISAMPFLAAKKASIPSVAISNFSWYEVLKFLPQESLEKLKNVYDIADLTIQLPLGTSMDHFKNKKRTGLVSRVPTKSKYELKKIFGIKKTESVILFALGGSTNEVACNVDSNIRILTMNTKVKKSLLPLDVSSWREGQEIVAMSDLVICKCGYGFISECLTNGIPFYYISDDNHLEQKAMSDELEMRGLFNRINFESLPEMNLTNEKISSHQTIKEEIRTNEVVKYVLEMLKN